MTDAADNDNDVFSADEREEIALIAACCGLSGDEMVYRLAQGIPYQFSIDAFRYQLALLNQGLEKTGRYLESTGQVHDDFPELAKKYVWLAALLVEVSGDQREEVVAGLADELLEFAGHLKRLAGAPAN
jgi:hypothetical protein